MADSDLKSAVLGAADIVQVIGQSVGLKKRGKDYVGLCPFHSEKTPSFHVAPDKQFFHCYGCKAGGNVIDFVMKRDRIEFMEALRLLAEQSGLDVSKFSRGGGGAGGGAGQRQQLLDLHTAAAAFFTRQLEAPTGQEAREYLAKRGFTAETVKQFAIGFAPPGWDNLLRSREMTRFGPTVAGLMALGGLAKSRDAGGGGGGGGGGHYDTFRHRLMFPIRDETGRTIAFGGRVMPGSTDPAKYLNSPETPLFNKSRAIFGLDMAKRRIVETRTVAVVEGYTDVVMAHQFGASNVVSPLGTALTESHLNILRRFADRVVLLYDADAAGDAAMARTVELFLSQPVELAIGSIPDGLDPDEFLLRDGLEGMDRLLAQATDALTFVWRRLAKDYDSMDGDLTRQQKAVTAYLEMLANARATGLATGKLDQMRWGMTLARVSRLTGISAEDLNRQFKARSSRPSPNRFAPQRLADGSTTTPNASQPNQPAQSSTTSPTRQSIRQGYRAVRTTAAQQAEGWLLAAIMLEPTLWQSVQKHVKLSEFSDPDLSRLAARIWDRWAQEGEADFAEFLAELGQADEAPQPEVSLQTVAIELFEQHRDRMEPQKLAMEATQYFAIRRDRAEREQVAQSFMGKSSTSGSGGAAVSPTQTGGDESKRASSDLDDLLLKKLQEKARKPDLTRKPAV